VEENQNQEIYFVNWIKFTLNIYQKYEYSAKDRLL